jgi:methylated-DNA-protein-cysteine methyltransferase related protein
MRKLGGANAVTPRRSELAMSWEGVYRLVKKVPRGRVITYGDLARALKLPGGARAVGYALAACPRGRGVPWQRVVGAKGRLLISEPHASLQRQLLKTEGVVMLGRQVDMAACAWSPKYTRSKRKSSNRAKRGATRR